MDIDKKAFRDLLKESFQELCQRKRNKEILSWLATTGVSCEKWFQFEFGFYLNSLLGKYGLCIYPELQRIDLPVFGIKEANEKEGWVQTLNIGIELKHLANWYTRKEQYGKIKGDINKIKDSDTYSLLILFAIFAKPNKEYKNIKWMRDQIENDQQGISEYKKFKDDIEKKEHLGASIICEKWEIGTINGFDEFFLTMMVYENNKEIKGETK
jgi:hypothetical protein